MSDIVQQSSHPLAPLTSKQAAGAWIVGTVERVIVILFLFVITGGVTRLLLQGPDTIPDVFDVAVLMTRDITAAETSALGRLLSVPVYGAVLIVVLVSLPEIWTQLRRNLLLMVPIALAFTSFLWSVDPSLTLRGASGLGLCTLYGTYLTVRFGFQDLYRLLAISFIAMAALSLMFVVALPSLATMGDGLWRGIFTHKNSLGQVMAWGVVVCLATAFSPRNCWLALMGLPMIVTGLLFSASMTAIVSAFVAAILMIGLWVCRRIQKLIPLLISVVVFAFGLLALTNIIPISGEAMGTAVGKDSTLTGRTELWEAAWWWIAHRFWSGYGYAAFWTSSGPGLQLQQMIAWPTPNSHNGLLELWLGIGAVGVVATIALLGQMALRGVVAFNRLRGAEQISCLGVLATTLFINSTEAPLLTNSLDWMIMVASLTAVRMSLEQSSSEQGA